MSTAGDTERAKSTRRPWTPAAERPLPATLTEAVRIEFGRAFHSPYETPIVVVVNGVLMCAGWFLAPAGLKNALFSLHGALAFPLVLAGWMFSDVPATNVLGSDATRVLRALDDPVAFRRLLYAKNIVLWLLIAPLCSLIAVGVGVNTHDYISMGCVICGIAVIPFGVLGVSAWLGIWFPYHPIPLDVRWRNRRPFRRMIVRWLTLAATPYGLVPALSVLALVPSLVLWGLFAHHGLHARLSDTEFIWGMAVALVVAAVGIVGGHHAGTRLVHRRAEKLRAYLADPSLG